MPEGIRIPQPGDVLAGKYRLGRVLGEGGMGVVLEAEHLRLRQPIAIKFLNPTMLDVAEVVERFDREARAAATLRSRHVVRVTDVEQTPEGVPYMVMELLVGSDLESERERRGQIPYAEAVDYVLQACGALAEAHDAGIIHRDLKPANLFLAQEEDRVVVKILDFGISKFLSGEDTKLTSAGAVMGTALYMSPEQIRGDATVSARSDIWSLGVILYELISGVAPWTGPATRVAAGIVSDAPPSLVGRCAIPPELAQLIARMLEKDPARRPQTISDVSRSLASFVLPGTVGAEVAETLVRRSQRNLGMPPGFGASSLPPSYSSLGPPSQNPQAISSPPYQPSSPARSNSERSTMAATTTSASRARPRMVGALAGFGALAIAGIALILFVGRTRTGTGGAGGATVAKTGEATTTIATATETPPAATAAVPAPSVSGSIGPLGSAAHEPSPPPTNGVTNGSASAEEPLPSGRPPAGGTKRAASPPAHPVTPPPPAHPVAPPPATTPAGAASAKPSPPPKETAPAINPPFLK